MDELVENFERAIRHIKKKFNRHAHSNNGKRGKNNHSKNNTKRNLNESKKNKITNEIKRSDDFLSDEPRRKRPRKKISKEEALRRKKKKRKDEILEIVKFFIPIVIIAIAVFFFILKTSSHMVDGNSMSPTLTDGDKVIVKRTKTPERYEIITFKPPVKSEYQYVKRIIGMPGDNIWSNGSTVYINQKEKIDEKTLAEGVIPDGTVIVTVSSSCLEQISEYKEIPGGHYFVLGDNRENSSDSREFGLVEAQAIEGVVSYRFSPFKSMGWIK